MVCMCVQPSAEGSGRRLRSRVPRTLNGAATRGLLEAEGTPSASAGAVCGEFNPARSLLPGALGAGAAVNVNSLDSTSVEDDDYVIAAEGELPAAELPVKRRLQLLGDVAHDVRRMLLLEAEAAVTVASSRMHVRRSLLDIDFADSATLEASAPTVGVVASGPCAGATTTPTVVLTRC